MDTAALCAAAREHREHGERRGTLHPSVWQHLSDSAIATAALPAVYGGLQSAVPQILNAVRQVAYADPSAGWAAAVHAPAGAFLSRLDEPTARTVLGGGVRPVIAGSSLPAGTIREAGGVLRLSGRWPLVTGAEHASLLALAARTPDGGSPVWFLLPRKEVTVHQDWDALGLRGSASCSVSCDTTVPAGHSVLLTGPALVDDPLYRFPLYGLMAATIATVAEAAGQRALDAFARLAPAVRPRHADGPLARLGGAQDAYAQAGAQLAAASGLLERTTAAAWSAAVDGPVGEEERARLRAACCHMAQTAESVCRTLFEAAGSAAVHRASEVEGCWRDALVISRHALVAGRGRQLAGAYLLSGTAAEDL
ncbi:hypothetical protein ABT354_19395 [Streptomyces sp. NPDC000594]|uniref:hypothetical protein n=1 Tax=Streptomyces sp. NPDC000594 TaxID=3154261 RepID=UPI00331D04A0